MEMKYCRQCGKLFMPRSGANAYCSEECIRQRDIEKSKAWRDKAIICKTCGKYFVPNSARKILYCSEECRKEGRRKANREFKKRQKERSNAVRYGVNGSDPNDLTGIPTQAEIKAIAVARSRSIAKRRKENMNLLAQDVLEAERLGMSYGYYMAMKGTI